MEIIYKPRRSGKTTELIKACILKGGYIVCNNEREAHRIQEQAKDMGYKIPLPITYDELINKQYSKNISKLHIDNLGIFLDRLTQGKVETITLNHMI